MNLDMLLVVALALLSGLAVFALIIGLFTNNKKLLRERQMSELIESLTRSEIEADRIESGIPNPKTWSGYWYKMGIAAGIDQPTPHRMGILAASLAAIAFFLGTFAWPRDFIIGLVAAVIIIVIFQLYLSRAANKRLTEIDKQLPNLLAGMRANLSANMTPQQAILSQVGEIPSPLGDELYALKADLDLNIPLDTALADLSKRVPSGELHFLTSSMRIAISQGANLDELLKTLQDILVDRAKIRDKLATAVAQAQPTLWVVVIAIPLGLVFSYTSNEQNREYWFSIPGLVSLGIIGALYAAALFVVRKQIQRVKDS